VIFKPSINRIRKEVHQDWDKRFIRLSMWFGQRTNSKTNCFYKCKRNEGKPHKVVIIACAKKL